jgi:multiple sugar transport system permease protein
VLTPRDVQTAPVVATSFMSGYEPPRGKLMATGTLIVSPVALLSLMASRHLIRDLMMEATK